jgi:hypothetical protein
MGFSIYPQTKMSAERMVRILTGFGTSRILVDSAADWGRSDPLSTRRTADAMTGSGFSPQDVDRVFWQNPVEFYGQSGRLELGDTPLVDTGIAVRAAPEAEFAGNSIRRGAE